MGLFSTKTLEAFFCFMTKRGWSEVQVATPRSLAVLGILSLLLMSRLCTVCVDPAFPWQD